MIAFGALTLAAVLVIVFVYAQVPTLLGYKQMNVTAIFPDGAGIYRNANVTSQGVGIGKITDIRLTPDGVAVTMRLDSDVKVEADARAEIHSVSAVGEQYVDLVSDKPDGPYLTDGAVIPMNRTQVPVQIAPVLDKAQNLLASIPDQGLETFLDEGAKAFHNLGPDLRTLSDSAQQLLDTADANYTQTSQLIRDIGPLLDTQNQAADQVRGYFANLAHFTGVLRDGDQYIRSGFPAVGHAANSAADFLRENENGVPILASSTTTLGQVLGVYRPGIEQVLVTYPVVIGWEQLFAADTPNYGFHVAAELEVHQNCSTGYQPQMARNPQDVSDAEAVPGTYCNVPHDDPRVVRGARNIPCLEGDTRKRAAFVQQCLGEASDEPVPGSAGSVIAPGNPLGSIDLPQRGPLTPPDTQEPNPLAGTRRDEPLSIFGVRGSHDDGRDQTWQSLLTAPVGR
nr:MCE family protein [Pseudonocardia acidicola]